MKTPLLTTGVLKPLTVKLSNITVEILEDSSKWISISVLKEHPLPFKIKRPYFTLKLSSLPKLKRAPLLLTVTLAMSNSPLLLLTNLIAFNISSLLPTVIFLTIGLLSFLITDIPPSSQREENPLLPTDLVNPVLML